MDYKLERKSTPVLSIVIPVYNEEEVFNKTVSKLEPVFRNLILEQKVLKSSFILFVDDGSKDNTWSMVKKLCEQNECFRGIKSNC